MLSKLSGSKRTLSFEYDTLGQKVSVKHPNITYGTLSNSGVLSTGNSRPETQFTYNAFGEVIKTSEKIANNSWADSYFYYDSRGNKTFEVDSEGYVNRWQYNSFGEVQYYTEFSTAVGSISTDTHPEPGSSTNDRKWQYQYDELGRRTQEIQLSVNVDTVSSNTVSEQTQNIITSTSYDGLSNVISTSHNGKVTRTKYDAYDRAITTIENKTTVLSGDVDDLATNLTSTQAQLVTQYRYDAFGNVITTLQGTGIDTNSDNEADSINENALDTRKNLQFYNARGQVIKTVDAFNNETLYQYDFSGNMVEQKSAYQVDELSYIYDLSTTISYNDSGVNITKEGAFPTWLSFDKSTGRIYGQAPSDLVGTYNVKLTVSDKEGSILKSYNPINISSPGQSVDTTPTGWSYAPQTGGTQYAVTEFHYDDIGQVTEVARLVEVNGVKSDDPESKLQTIYNSYGEVIFRGDDSDEHFTASDNRPLQEYFNYNDAGQLISSNAGDGVAKTYLYDLQGNLIKQHHLANGDTLSHYDTLGRIDRQYQASFTVNGVTLSPDISQSYDRWGNLTRLTDADGRTTLYSYNHNNQLVKERRPLVKVVDEQGIASYQQPTFTNYYNADGQLIARQDANSASGALSGQSRFYTFFTYTSSGQQSSVTNANGHKTQYAYNAFGERVAAKDATGYITTNKVDLLGRVIETGDIRVLNDGSLGYQSLNSFGYDELGNRVSQRNALGNEYYYQYDTQGRILRSLSPEGVSMSYRYDGQGNKTKESYDKLAQGINSNLHVNTWSYDYFGRMQSLNDLGGNKYLYDYNGKGQLNTKKADLGGNGSINQTATYTYYDNGLLKSIHDSEKGASTRYEYDVKGQQTLVERSTTNLLGEVNHETTTTRYDSNGRISEVVVKDKAGEDDKILSAIVYSYDAMGNRRSMQVVNGYSGNVLANDSAIPVFNSEFENYAYFPATRDYGYSYNLGVADTIFYDPDSELEYSLQPYTDENDTTYNFPDWLELNKAALEAEVPSLILQVKQGEPYFGSVPSSALDEERFVIMAKEVDGENFTLLPITLFVVNNLSPRFIKDKHFNDLSEDPGLEIGKSFEPFTVDFDTYIEDPELLALNYSINYNGVFNGPDINDAQDTSLNIEDWFSIDTSQINQGKVTFSPLLDAQQKPIPVPAEFLDKTIRYTVTADDGVRNTEFLLNFTVSEFAFALPEEGLTLKQNGLDEIDLFDFVQGSTDGVRFEILPANIAGLTIDSTELNSDTNSLLSLDETEVLLDPNLIITINVYRDTDDITATEPEVIKENVSLTLDGRPQPPSISLINRYLSDRNFDESGSGSFRIPAFTDINGTIEHNGKKYDSSLGYDFFLIDNNGNQQTIDGVSFTEQALTYDINDGQPIHWVTYKGTNSIPENIRTLRIIARQPITNGPISEPVDVSFDVDTVNNQAPIVVGGTINISEGINNSYDLLPHITNETLTSIESINVYAVSGNPPQSSQIIPWITVDSAGLLSIDFNHETFNANVQISKEFFLQVTNTSSLANELDVNNLFTITAQPKTEDIVVAQSFSLKEGESLALSSLVNGDYNSIVIKENSTYVSLSGGNSQTNSWLVNDGQNNVSFNKINNYEMGFFTLLVEDLSGEVTPHTVNIVHNTVPVVNTNSSIQVKVGEAFSQKASFSDVNATDQLTFSYELKIGSGNFQTKTLQEIQNELSWLKLEESTTNLPSESIASGSSGEVTFSSIGNVPASAQGSYQIKIFADDGVNDTPVTAIKSITVNNNLAPVINAIDQQGEVGTYFDQTFSISDLDGTKNFQATNLIGSLPEGLLHKFTRTSSQSALATYDLRIWGTPIKAESQNITIDVKDGEGIRATESININIKPKVISIPDQSGKVGEKFSYTAYISDPSGGFGTMFASLSNAPDSIYISDFNKVSTDPATTIYKLTISGTPKVPSNKVTTLQLVDTKSNLQNINFNFTIDPAELVVNGHYISELNLYEPTPLYIGHFNVSGGVGNKTLKVLSGQNYTVANNTVTVTDKKASGDVDINIQITDDAGTVINYTAVVEVNRPPLGGISAQTGFVNEDYSERFKFEDVDSLANMQGIASNLPPGLDYEFKRLSPNSETAEYELHIFGKPTTAGTFESQARITDSGGTHVFPFEFTIKNRALLKAPELKPDGTIGAGEIKNDAIYIYQKESSDISFSGVSFFTDQDGPDSELTIVSITDLPGFTYSQTHISASSGLKGWHNGSITIKDNDAKTVTKSINIYVDPKPTVTSSRTIEISNDGIARSIDLSNYFSDLDIDGAADHKLNYALLDSLNISETSINDLNVADTGIFSLTNNRSSTSDQNWTLTIRATDTKGQSIEANFTIVFKGSVVPTYEPPQLKPNGYVYPSADKGEIKNGVIYRYQNSSASISIDAAGYFTDPDGNDSELRIQSISGLPEFSINSAKTRIVATPSALSGNYLGSVTIVDSDGQTQSASINILLIRRQLKPLNLLLFQVWSMEGLPGST